MARLAAALLVAVAAAVWWPAAVEGLGMNWGTQASHPLPPKAVVQLLKDNGVKKVKLFDSDFAAMSALSGSGIEVMVGIPNNMLSDMAGDSGTAKDWVKRNVKRYDFDGGVTIKFRSAARNIATRLAFATMIYAPIPWFFGAQDCNLVDSQSISIKVFFSMRVGGCRGQWSVDDEVVGTFGWSCKGSHFSGRTFRSVDNARMVVVV